MESKKKQRKIEISVHIPEEVVEEHILVQLPVKSLVRFKSVCKRWRSWIQSCSFTALHRRRHCNDYSDQLVFSRYTSFTSFRTTPFNMRIAPSPAPVHLMKLRELDVMLPPKMTQLECPEIAANESKSLTEFLGPWRGAVLVLGPLTTGIYCVVSNLHRGANTQVRVSIATGQIAFCNPTTRDYKFTNPFPPDSIPLLSKLAQQPCRVHYGFGTVHHQAKWLDYKVVVVMSWGYRFTSFLSFVYSLRRGVWDKIAHYDRVGGAHESRNATIAGMTTRGWVHYPEICTDLEMCPQRFFNGSWHWMAVTRDSNYKYAVLSFHMGDEAFKLIGGPPGYIAGCDADNKRVECGVLVLNHHLAAIYFSSPGSSCRDVNIDVWMMMEYGVEQSWTKIYAIKPTCTGIERLVGISSSLRDDCIGGIHIAKILYEGYNRRFISCDDSGATEHDAPSDYHPSSSIYWNTLGLSAYTATLEPLQIQQKCLPKKNHIQQKFDQVA